MSLVAVGNLNAFQLRFLHVCFAGEVRLIPVLSADKLELFREREDDIFFEEAGVAFASPVGGAAVPRVDDNCPFLRCICLGGLPVGFWHESDALQAGIVKHLNVVQDREHLNEKSEGEHRGSLDNLRWHREFQRLLTGIDADGSLPHFQPDGFPLRFQGEPFSGQIVLLRHRLVEYCLHGVDREVKLFGVQDGWHVSERFSLCVNKARGGCLRDAAKCHQRPKENAGDDARTIRCHRVSWK